MLRAFVSLLIVFFALLTAACGSDVIPTTPTAVPAATVASAVEPKPAAPTPTPAIESAISVTGGHGDCRTTKVVPGEVVIWTIKIDKTPNALHLVAMSFHSDKAGCNATTDNGRVSTLAVDGAMDYVIGASGTIVVKYKTSEYACGSAQVDVGQPDANQPIIGEVFDYVVNCIPPASVTMAATCVAAPGSSTTNLTISNLLNVAKIFIDGPGTSDLTLTVNGTRSVAWPVGTYAWTATATSEAMFDNGSPTATGSFKVVDCSTPVTPLLPPDDPPMCRANVTAQIVEIKDQKATVRFNNSSNRPFNVSLTSYQTTSVTEVLLPQLRVDYHDFSLEPGTQFVSVSITQCWQVDPACGGSIKLLSWSDMYDGRLLPGAEMGGIGPCPALNK